MWVLGLVAGIVGIAAYIPYVRDILARKTKPERASWAIWGLEYAALFVAQAVQGASSSLWLIGLQFLGVLAICALSVKYGAGGFTKSKVVLLSGAVLALGAWYFTDNPNVAILLLVAIETAAIVPTVTKAYREPGSETMSTWALIGTAGLLTLPVVGTGNAFLFVYPASLVLINFGVVAAMLAGTRANPITQMAQEEA